MRGLILALASCVALVACSSDDGSKSSDAATDRTTAAPSTTLSAEQIAADEAAVDDVVITSCGPDAESHVQISGTVNNPSSDPADYYVQLRIVDATGASRFATAASATEVAAGQTAEWVAATTATYEDGMTCAVDSVTLHEP